jgi:hypothetical protein
VKKRVLTDGEELGIDWERWSDGMPHRLKRKRDFGDLEPDLVREAAKNAAKRMGKGVQASVDKMSPRGASRYVWVQFADHEIRVGDPCKGCGGRRLVRVHPFFANCAQCGARLLLAPKRIEDGEGIESLDEDEDGYEDDAPDRGGRPRADRLLRELTEVRLARLEHIDDRETYRGYARLGKTRMLVFAQFRAAPGESLTPDDALERVVAVQALPLRQLEGLLDPSGLKDPDEGWDLAF